MWSRQGAPRDIRKRWADVCVCVRAFERMCMSACECVCVRICIRVVCLRVGGWGAGWWGGGRRASFSAVQPIHPNPPQTLHPPCSVARTQSPICYLCPSLTLWLSLELHWDCHQHCGLLFHLPLKHKNNQIKRNKEDG